jgi:hypothetical protein
LRKGMKKEEYRKKIQEIIDKIHCPKNFECIENGFERLCKAKECGLENYLECLESNLIFPCSFMLNVDKTIFCQCPLRVYIEKKIKK